MRVLSLSLPLWVAVFPGSAWAATGDGLTADAVNTAAFSPLPEQPAKRPSAEIVRAEVLLDRARFSPGSIDGLDGDTFRKALSGYQTQAGVPSSGRLDAATWAKLTGADPAPVLLERKITAADLKGPFVKTTPANFERQAKLKRMAYKDVREELSEQYHTGVGLLQSLNAKARWTRPDTAIIVPQVVVDRPKVEVTRVDVDKPGHVLRAYAADGHLVAMYPASIGSEEKPAPSGHFEIRRVTHNPDYTYNPKYAFKGVKSKVPFTIASGPNNPVGSVWMDLSYAGYGIHGTPEPNLVGKTQSHGCIRLTNWDAEDLASMVSTGTGVNFLDASMPNAAAAAVPPGNNPAAPAMVLPDAGNPKQP